ncbi:F-box/LRR-repeat protein At4g14103 [Brachypodium distachyon]|uniref:F-box domain-containing protein n=1 Tax=Brachypodium distachyon TaxID=15368 RepID=A0A0Q3EBL5_BRADI|nr:F-box/LRR-repeat protein At4g14103 [Brachypodium distachyon]KQJ85151.1 hypothetical protein BRADI_5g25185v3 [Brachypodium distachyon]|eukprot:XP_010227329.1 F-box/LRR-repeat protein At4g14103 [Brachypodium distachyon]
MASRKKKRSSSSGEKRRDRISGLTDDVLGHVLSFLPNKEAGRAAALARRWRHVFGSVHTISLSEAERERAWDWDTFYFESEERKSCSYDLLDGVNTALLCRVRCAADGLPGPLRTLRIAFDDYHLWDEDAVDQWLAYALRHRRGGGGMPELHLDLCFLIDPVCTAAARSRTYKGTYVLPRRLFSCTSLRTLCLTHCQLELPAIIDMPFLETLRLTNLLDAETSIQRLISSCPRLVDLTLEALNELERLTILDKRLHRFMLRCCHNMKSVDIDASELRSFSYRGTMPAESLLCLHGSLLVPSWTIDLCKAPPKSGEAGFAGFARFLEKISDVKHLHLHRGSIANRFYASGGFPLFSSLTRLTLQGCIQSCETVMAVRIVLEQTPNLESLSLLMEEQLHGPAGLIVPDDRPSFSEVPCLQRQVMEIGMEGYEGSKAQKMLAKLLLRNALVLQRLHVVFVEGMKRKRRSRLETKLGEWAAANSEKIFR